VIALDIQNTVTRNEKILSLLQSVDIVNFVTLRKLFGLLHEFADEKNSSVSKMNASNLALVWTPNLFRVDSSLQSSSTGSSSHSKHHKDTKPLSTNDVIRIANLNHKLQEIVVSLIQNYEFFFKVRQILFSTTKWSIEFCF
jgi:hypothetical protein